MLKFRTSATDAELKSAMKGVIKFDLDDGGFAAKVSASFMDSTGTMEKLFRLQSTQGETTPLIGPTT
jgi:hypothetical protein